MGPDCSGFGVDNELEEARLKVGGGFSSPVRNTRF